MALVCQPHQRSSGRSRNVVVTRWFDCVSAALVGAVLSLACAGDGAERGADTCPQEPELRIVPAPRETMPQVSDTPSSPDAPARLLTPSGFVSLDFSPEERQREIAVRRLRQSEHSSHALVRVRTAEKPHVHDQTDLTVFVLSGRVKMHLGERVVEMAAGDVIDIPRGIAHWAENIAPDASVAYVIFAPAYDGTDQRFTQ